MFLPQEQGDFIPKRCGSTLAAPVAAPDRKSVPPRTRCACDNAARCCLPSPALPTHTAPHGGTRAIRERDTALPPEHETHTGLRLSPRPLSSPPWRYIVNSSA